MKTTTSLKWAVYWQPKDVEEISFFKTRDEAQAFIGKLIEENDATIVDERGRSHWEITLLEVKGLVQEIPYDGDLALMEAK